jgi:hypothetical protein
MPDELGAGAGGAGGGASGVAPALDPPGDTEASGWDPDGTPPV